MVAAYAGGELRELQTRLLVSVGVNCVHPRHVEKILSTMRAHCDLPLVVYPNKVTIDGCVGFLT